MLGFYYVDNSYIQYLKIFDKRVPNELFLFIERDLINQLISVHSVVTLKSLKWFVKIMYDNCNKNRGSQF